MPELIWRGFRDGSWEGGGDTRVVMTVIGSDVYAELPLYLDEVNHSPTGFEWGYNGSGPAQLAYAILRSYSEIVLGLGPAEDLARQNYQKFKHDYVSHIFGRQNEWLLTSYEVTDWLKKERYIT